MRKVKIARGNTVAGVNEKIIEFLKTLDNDFADQAILDVPCGNGEFLQALENYFPSAHLTGADITPPKLFSGNFVLIDAQQSFSIPTEKKFSAITCISGVMEFDNTLAFFEQLKTQLAERGLLIVTNDNLLTVRDRLLYLFFGRTSQFRLFTDFSKPTWKVLTLQNLRRILWEAGFEAREIYYAPVSPKEWLWLPLASLIYLIQWLYLRSSEKNVNLNEKQKMLSFASLLSRHYIFVCQPSSEKIQTDSSK